MNKERPYLESQLTLPQLAQQLGISPNYLSQVINEQLQKNFFDFINEYRVAEAKSKLTADSTTKGSIADVAYDSGFNSKSAFYTAFKKHVGMTPSEFRASASRANQV
jgi:AraC-like DNA-binding protein